MDKDNKDEFDEIIMGEIRMYREGHAEGVKEGYRQALSRTPRGCSCGIEISYELAMYQAFLTVHFNNKLTKQVSRMLQDFKTELENFDFNSSLVDISNKLQLLKKSYNKLCGALMLPNEKNGTKNEDITF